MSAFEQTKLTSSARHLLRVALVSFIILVVALLLERWRGQYALAAWKRAMTAQGEVFDLAKLWPPPSASALAFSNQFAQARNQLPEDFQYYCGTMNGIAEGQAGKARRGSQEPWPLVDSPHGTNSTRSTSNTSPPWPSVAFTINCPSWTKYPKSSVRRPSPKTRVQFMILGAARTGSGRKSECRRAA
jgi:hypothetical protein